LPTQKPAVDYDRTGSFDLVRSQLEHAIGAGDISIPMLPEVAAQVVAAAGDPETSARDMAKIIYADPALAAHVMRVVRSAAYRPLKPIQSLHHAISWLGMAEVCEIAFTAAVKSRLLNVPRQRVRAERLWATAVGTAAWGRAIADVSGRGGEASYLAGLMHEIGTPVCLQVCVDIATKLELVMSDATLDALVAEFTTEIGGRVARAWQMPETVVAVIEAWSAWPDAGPFRDPCAVTFLAHQLAEHTLARTEPLAMALADDPVVGHLRLQAPALAGIVGQSAQIRAVVDNFRA
jgi:HD-like signal output (HDOD) protein